MTHIDTNKLHRLVKLALDSGEAESIDQAHKLFSGYRLHVRLGENWNASWATQAALVTIFNTASRAFLGGVVISGCLDERVEIPLYRNLSAREIAERCGVDITHVGSNTPTLLLGDGEYNDAGGFCVRVECSGWQAGIAPTSMGRVLPDGFDNPVAGVAAGALGVSEAFLHVRGELAAAGNRVVGISLWNPADVDDWMKPENRGPELTVLPKAIWLVGLGHLGQAYAWTLAMLPYAKPEEVVLFLQDTDVLSDSNLSTCLFANVDKIGQKKTRLVSEAMESIGFRTHLVERLFEHNQSRLADEPRVVLFGVDNVSARRMMETAGFDLIVEAGLGSGYRDFRNLRIHTFPGPRTATSIWAAEDGVQQAVNLSPVYQRMAHESGDECGVTMLASRAVGTPFVGAFAATMVLAEFMAMFYGRRPSAIIDFPMRDVRHRTVAPNTTLRMINPGQTAARCNEFMANRAP